MLPGGLGEIGNGREIANPDIVGAAQARDLAREPPSAPMFELVRLEAALRRNDEQRFRLSVAGARKQLVIAVRQIVEPENVAAIVVFDPAAALARAAILQDHLPFDIGAGRGPNANRAVCIGRDEWRNQRATHPLHCCKRIACSAGAGHIKAERCDDAALRLL